MQPRTHSTTDRYTDAHEVARLTAEAAHQQEREIALAAAKVERHRLDREAARRGRKLIDASERWRTP